MIKIISPLSVPAGKKKFYLNLNVYRNSHYQILDQAKKNYKFLIAKQLIYLTPFKKVNLELNLYPKTKRLTDLDNVLSIHLKFFCDALVYYKKIPDDNYLYIPEINYRFGAVNKMNPRVEIIIKEI